LKAIIATVIRTKNGMNFIFFFHEFDLIIIVKTALNNTIIRIFHGLF